MAGASYSVVLIDDDQFLLDMYMLKFREAGHTVEGFTSGDEALKYLRQGKPAHAIVMDMVMPGMDGLAILEALGKEKLASEAIKIVLSNQGQDSDISAAKERGAQGYIIKASAVPSDVLKEVINIIEKHKPGI